MNGPPVGAGKSSFDLIRLDRLLSALSLNEGQTVLDVGCGNGNYTLAIAQVIGNNGSIFAIDMWEDGIGELMSRANANGMNNIHASVGDASRGIPVEDEYIDTCLMATVLHDLVQENADEGTLKEIWRVLKHDGRLVIIEFKKVEGPPGPPLGIRISPEELEYLLQPYGFHIDQLVEIGEFIYLSSFVKQSET
ncbi:class I SAM-dependent methyltransferase [Chloroflexota bacterium]